MDKLNYKNNRIYVLHNNQGYIELIDYMGNEYSILRSARITFGKINNNINDDQSDYSLLKFLIDNNHMSPFEHVIFTFLIKCPIYIRSQWFRHRTWAYSEISRRNTKKDITFYNPGENLRFIDDHINDDVKTDIIKCIESSNKKSYENYNDLISKGVKIEHARGVLSQNMMVVFYGTVNLRNLISFITLRSHYSSQNEIRLYVEAIKKLIQPILPNFSKYMKYVN